MNEYDFSMMSETGRLVAEVIMLRFRHDELRQLNRVIPGLARRGKTRELEEAIADKFLRLGAEEKTAVVDFCGPSAPRQHVDWIDGIPYQGYHQPLALWHDWISRHVSRCPGDAQELDWLSRRRPLAWA